MIETLFVLAVMVLWCLGGQYDKLYRRIGIPIAIIFLGVWRSLHGGIWWHEIPLLLICPELFLGYGPGSFAAKVFSSEFEIRAAYASLLWIPIAVTALLNSHSLEIMGFLFALVLAFQVRAGALFLYKDKAILIEDLCRSFVVGLAIVGVM
jgi:hypothetical protein